MQYITRPSINLNCCHPAAFFTCCDFYILMSEHYNLRKRSHSLQLPVKTSSLNDSGFIKRMPYKNMAAFSRLYFILHVFNSGLSDFNKVSLMSYE